MDLSHHETIHIIAIARDKQSPHLYFILSQLPKRTSAHASHLVLWQGTDKSFLIYNRQTIRVSCQIMDEKQSHSHTEQALVNCLFWVFFVSTLNQGEIATKTCEFTV